jgi:hypothetical protein
MESKDKKTAMQLLLNFYDWHTKLFKNVIDGISDKDAENRMGTKANHVAWLAGSLVQERFQLANFAGSPDSIKQTSDDLFKDHKGIQDNVPYPSLNEFKKDWETISPVLRKALADLTPEQLESADPYKMPGENLTFFDSITACTDRESYCIGQIALYRRLLGYEAMKYD